MGDGSATTAAFSGSGNFTNDSTVWRKTAPSGGRRVTVDHRTARCRVVFFLLRGFSLGRSARESGTDPQIAGPERLEE
jgi:hypothetical protein